MGYLVGEGEVNKAIEQFVAIPLIIFIGMYITACTLDPFLQLNNPFKLIFTAITGIPTLVFFYKQKYEAAKPNRPKNIENTEEDT
ncbi:MAG: hypothetical protein NWF03_01110 [Candidatus Bathyarchaeota archaeon]|nr:hypothetical protein [Candidatus Bathyarchaeota archaeon]